jgi:hypothetical protein
MLELDKTKCLYAYFGELGYFNNNIPGHSFYQVGLLDALAEKYQFENFDFYNYLDIESVPDSRPKFPDGIYGQIFTTHTDRLIDKYRMTYSEVLKNISNKVYQKLFLKARFRNLSTLEKKITDAYRFETIIQYALSNGYAPEDIIIVDTDMSLSPQFLERIFKLKIPVIVPSIDVPGIGQKFLASCMEVNQKGATKKGLNIIYYGNLSFENYKQGHYKNPIINEIIERTNDVFMFDQSTFKMTVAAKETPYLKDWIEKMPRVELVPRSNREAIWAMLQSSLVSVNVSKDLYIEKNFTPARVYESIIAGVIPVSYKKSHHPAMAFETTDEFFEICKFLAECSPADYFKILSQIASSL